ncbi:MAG: nucleoside triphosphate pyrophosphohydrolase family protein, partial [Bdellovibrionales bacterium]|nr:nucleoside triphosphate pyrophosphohydrolase family protein [Bdellovibrionales bacterium]
NIRLLHGAIGLATEAGEFLDALKKHIYYGRELDRVNLAEELGDIFWYCAIIADELNVPFAKIMETNIEKLKARYGEKFTEEKAENRNLTVEREILEN